MVRSAVEGSVGYYKTVVDRFNAMKSWQQVLVMLVVGVALWTMMKYVKGMFFVERFEQSESGNNKQLVCTMFYTEWCGYCKKAKPEWDKLMGEMHGQSVNKTNVVFRKIDCDKEVDLAKQYNIQGYPTFKFEMDGKVIDYDGGNTYSEFKNFINRLLGGN